MCVCVCVPVNKFGLRKEQKALGHNWDTLTQTSINTLSFIATTAVLFSF